LSVGIYIKVSKDSTQKQIFRPLKIKNHINQLVIMDVVGVVKYNDHVVFCDASIFAGGDKKWKRIRGGLTGPFLLPIAGGPAP
jgi:hypothetical protein